MNNLFKQLGINISEVANKQKKSNSKKHKKTTKRTTKKTKKPSSVDLFSTMNIGNFNTDSKEVPEGSDDESSNVMFNTLFDLMSTSTASARKTTKKIVKKIDRVIGRVLDFLVSREVSAKDMKTRYEDNKKAIEILNYLEETNTLANATQQTKLAKYVGWGGLANKFKEDSQSNEYLKNLLGENYASAKKSVNTAFYTNAVVIKFIYKVLEKLGFEKGRILDPSCGIGKFSMYMPEYTFYNSKIVNVEIDTISANITKNLFQSTKILNCGYQDTSLKDNSFDLVISNIPFGDLKIYDTFDKDLNEYNLRIHDYYFLKSIKKVRNQGIIAFITSTGTLDKTSTKFRKLIDNQCDFLGAVRLPNGTFGDTDAAADIIFLQKNIDKALIVDEEDSKDIEEENSKKIKRDWICSFEVDDGVYMNEYFFNNPETVLGEIEIVPGQFGPKLKIVNDEDLKSSSFAKLLKYFPSEIYVTPADDAYMYDDDELLKCTNENIKNNEFIILNSKIYQRQSDNLIPNSFTGVRQDKLYRYIQIKDILKSLIKEQGEGCSDERLLELQDALNSEYNEFVGLYGHLSERKNKTVLNDCILYCLVSALETYDFEKKQYVKAEIFSKRTIAVKKEFIPTNTVDAITSSFSNYGYLNIDYIADVLNRDYNDIVTELLADNTIFIDHTSINDEKLRYIYKDEYLSGYVKDKLKEVKAVVTTDDRLQANLKALEANQPEYVTEVSFNFASTWIPIKVKETFIAKTLKIDITKLKLLYTEALGYTIEFNGRVNQGLDSLEYGTQRRPSLTIVDAVLNNKDLTVVDIIYDGHKDKRVKNVEQTQLAMTLAEKWKSQFTNYVNSDPYLLKELTDIYNEIYIVYKERQYSNIFNTLNINPNIKLREHQLKAISRMIISNKNTLLCHSVGTGKTYTMVAYAEEMARIGLNTGIKAKTLFVIPNHLCTSLQFAKEYLTLYPGANILATTPDDFKPANRRKLIAKIALGDFTSIIIPFSVLSMIPLKPETEKKLLQEDLSELLDTLDYYNANDSSVSVKSLEKAKDNFQARIQELNDMHVDEGLLFWEDLGITSVAIDEAHNFKNLYFPKRLQVAGVTNVAAKKSQDLYNKIRYHRSIYGEKNIIFSTATPITNSMCELYTMLRYLYVEVLRRFNIYSFDAFASDFGEVVANMEIDPTGKGFRLNRRFAKFCNLPELIDMFRQVADVVNAQDVVDLKLPKRKNGQPIVEKLTPTEEMKEYIDTLVDRAEAISQRRVSPTEDNMLNVTNEGRKLTVAPRLVGIDQDSPKLLRVADILAEAVKEKPTETNLVFCDLGTPGNKNDYSAYKELKEHCINRGILAEDIKFMHDAKTVEQRKHIISDFNEGKFRVLISSTKLGGEGTNFQKHIANIIHIDVPWRPSDIEQRNGRALRVSNVNEEVGEYRMVVNSSFDAYSWQLIEFKSKYIAQILSATSSNRVAEDLESSCLDYETCKAAAANNPKLLELATVKKDIQNLQVMERAYKRQVMNAVSSKQMAETKVTNIESILPEINEDLKIVNSYEDTTPFETLKLQENSYCSIKDATEHLAELMKTKKTQTWGEIFGLPIEYTANIIGGVLNEIITIGKNHKFRIENKVYPKVMLESILNFKETLTNYSQGLETKKIDLIEDIQSFEERLTNDFSEKDKLEELLLKKASLETELNLNGKLD